MTGRLSLFNSPLFLGFDQYERTLDRIAKNAADSYPPYNIEQIGDNDLRITLAVAGFATDELSVQVEDNQLVIRGRQTDDKARVYLHRGIAARQFQRCFVLADGIEIVGATLDSGLLNIELRRPVPDSKVRTIKIERAGAARRAGCQTIGLGAEGSGPGGAAVGVTQKGTEAVSPEDGRSSRIVGTNDGARANVGNDGNEGGDEA